MWNFAGLVLQLVRCCRLSYWRAWPCSGLQAVRQPHSTAGPQLLTTLSRSFIAWIGSLPATKDNFKRLLEHGSVAVVVGGIAEMFMCHPDRERVKLLGRKGFCRIAVEQQVDGIVPVYYLCVRACKRVCECWDKRACVVKKLCREAVILL
jgi:hypothetical protein